jgi:GH18 family chitinase
VLGRNRLLIIIIFVISLQLCYTQEFNKNIIGYFTSWSIYVRDYHVPDIPVDKINHINYAFANINSTTGTIMLGDAYADIDKWYEGDSQFLKEYLYQLSTNDEIIGASKCILLK